MVERIHILPEPRLQMAYGQTVNDPRDGISFFGPYDLGMPSHPAAISYGLIGTPDGVKAFKEFVGRWEQPIINENNTRLWPPFPGFEAAFQCKWSRQPTHEAILNSELLLEAARNADPYARAASVVQAYTNEIERFLASDKELQVIICLAPDLVYTNCRSKSVIRNAVGAKPSRDEMGSLRAGQMDMFKKVNTEDYRYSVDFRRQIKAKVMAFGKPIQIIRESTFRLSDIASKGGRGLTPLSDRAWNLATTLYYKAGGQPWKLANARPGVCYVGIAFKKTDAHSTSPSACCAAQMFLDSGDGVVFRGQNGRWYSPERHAFHLDKAAGYATFLGVNSAAA